MEKAEHRFEKTLQWIEWLVANGKLPGVAIGIDIDGRRLVRTFGLETLGSDRQVTGDTRFPIGCLSKSLLALQCVEHHLRGRLDIHAPIRSLLPALTGGIGDTISIAHILSHSTGYAEPHGKDAFRAMSWDRLVQSMVGSAASFPPGLMWSYTQTGHAIVAEILTRIEGRTPFDGFKADFLDPLGIGPSDISSKVENLRTCASFHMYSSARRRYEPVRISDIGLFFRAAVADLPLSVNELLTLGLALMGDAETPISQEAIALARQPHVVLAPACSPPMAEIIPESYGYGAGLFGEYWAATGSYSGSSCAIRSCAKRKVTIALAMNAWAPGLRDQILSRAMTAVGGYERPPETIRLAFSEEECEGVRAKINASVSSFIVPPSDP